MRMSICTIEMLLDFPMDLVFQSFRQTASVFVARGDWMSLELSCP